MQDLVDLDTAEKRKRGADEETSVLQSKTTTHIMSPIGPPTKQGKKVVKHSNYFLKPSNY